MSTDSRRAELNALRWIILVTSTVLYGIPAIAVSVWRGPHWLMTTWGLGFWAIGITYFYVTRNTYKA